MGDGRRPATGAKGYQEDGKALQTSARNQFRGMVTKLKLGGMMADVTMDIGNGRTMSAVITRECAERLGFADGKAVIAMVKPTELIVATGS